MRFFKLSLICTCLCLLSLPAMGQKKQKVKVPPKDPQDEIELVGHITLNSGPVTRFIPTQHYSSNYLYVEHAAGNVLTLLDVTKSSQPLVLATMPLPGGGAGSLLSVAGTAGLVADSRAAAEPAPPVQSIRIMDFSDVRNPNVVREFTGVTAIQRDERRGLVFIAASDGVWILHHSLASDPEVERAYDYYVRYGPSMYPSGK
jgi:hypothetical protein